MSAIEASSGTYRCRVDGTIVLSVEIEPRYRDEFQKLFGAPGTPLAIAALKPGYAAVAEPVRSDDEWVSCPAKEASKPKGGPLSKLAGVWCNRVEFWEWIGDVQGQICSNAEDAAISTREICEVCSRAEFDNDPDASKRFNERIRGPFSKYMQARGIVL